MTKLMTVLALFVTASVAYAEDFRVSEMLHNVRTAPAQITTQSRAYSIIEDNSVLVEINGALGNKSYYSIVQCEEGRFIKDYIYLSTSPENVSTACAHHGLEKASSRMAFESLLRDIRATGKYDLYPGSCFNAHDLRSCRLNTSFYN